MNITTSHRSKVCQNFWTIKIAGVSGSGKTTVLARIERDFEPAIACITYSTLLKAHGSMEKADQYIDKKIKNSNGLIVIDEHLEFDNAFRTLKYSEHNTRGIILLDPPIADLCRRISNDSNKSRECDIRSLESDRAKSKLIANQLSTDLAIPLLIIENLEGELNQTITEVFKFLKKLSYDQ